MSLQRSPTDIMSEGTQIVTVALQLKDGAYTRVQYDILTQTPRLCPVDQQNGPKPENKVEMWKRMEHMVFFVKGGQQNYLLKVDGKKLMLEMTPNKPDIDSLQECYWFCKKKAAAAQQYRIHSKVCPTLCLIIKKEGDTKSFDLGDMKTTTSSIAIFITS